MRWLMLVPVLTMVSLSACGRRDAQPEKTASTASEAHSDASAYPNPVPAGLTAPTIPSDNPLTSEKVALGHALFFDKRLSVDSTRSCYSCHQNELGAADGRAKALGPGDKLLQRNTPTIWNVTYHRELYWDGRADSLEKQMLGAWKGGNMGVGDDKLAAKATEIGTLEEYKERFASVFGLGAGDVVTPEHVAKAVSAYERTLLCGDSPYDKKTMSDAAQRGWTAFNVRGCVACHNGPNFSDGVYHNAGIGVPAGGEVGPDTDIGRGKVTKDPADNFKFRTPTLRNVARTAPYFHDGSMATLREATTYMATGGHRAAPNIDPLLREQTVADHEIDDLVAFLEALDCPGKLEVIGDQRVVGIPR